MIIKWICFLSIISTIAYGREDTRPNIIFLMADDLSPMWFSAYGEKPEVKTPNFDRMVNEGVGFTNAWCTPMCSPTRALVLSGQYGMRTGWLHNSLKVGNNIAETKFLKKGVEPFIGQVKKAGYKTAFCGRWGIPATWEVFEKSLDEFCKHESNPNRLPDGYKFKKFVEEGNKIFAIIEDRRTADVKELRFRTESKQGYGNPYMSRYWNPSLSRNGVLMETTESDFSSDLFTEFALDFAKRNKDQPFMIYYPMFLTHGTSAPGKDKLPSPPHLGDLGNIGGGDMKVCSEYLDVILGKFLKGIEELGLSENTIFIFNSDNGDTVYGKTRAIAKGPRVPYAIWGPGLVKQRGMVKNLTEFSDLYPTFLEFAEAPRPNQELDGISIKDFILGESEQTRDTIYSYIGTARMARNKDYVLEAVDPFFDSPNGRFYKTNGEIDPAKFKEVSMAEYSDEFQELFEGIENLPQANYETAYSKKLLEKYKKTKFRHRLE